MNKTDKKNAFGVSFIILGIVLTVCMIFLVAEIPDLFDSITDLTEDLTDRELLEKTFFCSFATIILIVILPMFYLGTRAGFSVVFYGLRIIFPKAKWLKDD